MGAKLESTGLAKLGEELHRQWFETSGFARLADQFKDWGSAGFGRTTAGGEHSDGERADDADEDPPSV